MKAEIGKAEEKAAAVLKARGFRFLESKEPDSTQYIHKQASSAVSVCISHT